ncbi:uncharacterized protein F5Z01DRAFT_448532 [Emericellopsis atlantica]|uniref:RRM domain-containing protein n=1 Tax=Emericellopsis atlantica TaxID=2614577 RepID=A0A9P7ZSI7_9HYPO|nr:uncharacterized protein F5Z01DRAFT_448532 [Emericellopsis atlantica]KAG9257047.1 hypothetical protein F5Z01DRAFT_448532 [Emericellopsis atlantica]
MAYPPPPGTANLPARPPPSNSSSSGGFNKGGFKPAFSSQPQTYGAQPQSYNSQPQSYAAPASSSSYAPPAPPAAGGHYGPSYPGVSSAAPASTSTYSYNQPPASYSSHDYGTAASSYAAPQIKNPFPIGGQSAAPGGDFDPEMAAQIAQWQSAYVTKEGAQAPAPGQKPEYAAPANPERKKTVAREGGGKKWTDDTLLEWDPSHMRLFVGNLAGETTDDSLLKAFSRWESVQKARVIRDKRTTKSKGYGFVSFSNADDFFAAAKEMNGKYIQSHPVTIKKANTEIKVANVKERDRGRGKNNRNNNKKKSGSGGGTHGSDHGHDAHMGSYAGAGITKPGQKTKNGLKLLG